MPTLSAITLLINGLTLSLSIGFLILILWHDAQRPLNQFFSAFLIFVVLWNTGSLLVQVGVLTQLESGLLTIALSVTELGFAGASISGYILATVLAGAHTRRFLILAVLSVFLIVTYRLFLIVNSQGNSLSIGQNSVASQYHALTIAFYLSFDIATAYVIWRYRRRIRSRALSLGIVIFILGQGLSFINPELAISELSTSVSAIGVLVISFSIVQQEIIAPLNERNSQVESMHRVSLAISSQMAVDKTLNEIAIQAAGWLSADGVSIFLAREESLELVNVYHMPEALMNSHVDYGQGVAGTVALTQTPIFLENYDRDWTGQDEFLMARQSFGSMICVPLIYGGEIIGVLSVISGKHGRLFNQQDVHLLKLVSAQAAVAIAHGRLFAEQRSLAEQLETVLISTENPVIAVNRNLSLIFTNPAANSLFGISEKHKNKPLNEWLPSNVFPEDLQATISDIRKRKMHIYEMNLDNRVFLCHLAILGRPRIRGWVAVLNDVTELKELDRLKSEMVRMASHDLKNPLMGAMAYLELLIDELRDEAQPLDRAETLQAAVNIERQLERMNRIIKGVLDLERLRSFSELRDVIDPQALVKSAIDELEFQILDVDVDLKVVLDADLPPFLGNREQFTRAIVNLVENALKFSLKDRKCIEVEVREVNGKIIFTITDNGVGIPDGMQNRVFDRFFRAEQEGVQHVTGSGLGLNLVKSIVEHHEGKIWLKSEVGVGTTFYVEVSALETSTV